MALSYNEYLTLLLLQENPNITYASVAEFFNISTPTAKKRIEELKLKGIYRGKKVQYIPEALGLTRYIVLIFVDNLRKLTTAEKALDIHPYTTHRSRVYGSKLGLYSMFDFPSVDGTLLEDFFMELKKMGIIRSFRIFQSIGIRKDYQIDLKQVSIRTMFWEYNWDDFTNALLYTHNNITLPKPHSTMLSMMKEIDFKILRILTFNADITKKEISRRLNTNPTEVWRRIQFLEENVLSGYRAKINRQYFNVSSTKLIVISFTSVDALKKCFYAFTRTKRPPFRYTLEIVTDNEKGKKLVLYVSLPQYHEAQLCYALSQIGNLEVYNLDTTGEASVTYSFYEGNFDFKNRIWKKSKEYIIDEPIKKLITDENLTNAIEQNAY
ncbi:MAG: hypothetical protein DRI86_11825 [Bacteroidetes bacterium]|nr:MAG: hypothetical protein DRI86_11825 [Bacteroidota bacterium]